MEINAPCCKVEKTRATKGVYTPNANLSETAVALEVSVAATCDATRNTPCLDESRASRQRIQTCAELYIAARGLHRANRAPVAYLRSSGLDDHNLHGKQLPFLCHYLDDATCTPPPQAIGSIVKESSAHRQNARSKLVRQSYERE